jgi:predicted SprT family Zn-dependent metalloprotease
MPKPCPRQQWFNFFDLQEKPALAPSPPPESSATSSQSIRGRDAQLEKLARKLLGALGFVEGVEKIEVRWMPRMRSTAGYAKWPHWKVELNPRLREFSGEVDRTLRHELAHLVAHARAGRRRIAPHGPEWRRACADLGIPNEGARHTLPLPSRRLKRNFTYACPSCGVEVERVRRFRRRTACLACCRRHNRGRYDGRFEFALKAAAR